MPETLGALAGQGELEIVVVDNASSDATAEVAGRAGARVVHEARPGRALARNAGAQAASGGLLLFLDAECVPEPGWLEALARCLERAPLAAGPVRIATGAAPAALELFDSLWRFQQERTISTGGWATSANLGVRRDAFETLGGFDPAYVHGGEDVDLCLRARRVGLALAFCRDAAVHHPGAGRTGEVVRRGFRQGHASTQLRRRLGDRAGRRYWSRPRAAVSPGKALEVLRIDSSGLSPRERRTVSGLAMLDYGGRMLGSLWADLRRAR